VSAGVSLFRRGADDGDLDLHLAQDDLELRAAWDAARAGDPGPARELMATTRADPDRRARYVWVFGESTTATPWAATPSDPERFAGPVDTTAAWTDRWEQAEPENPDAVLVRARSLIMRAWEVRGSGWARYVGANAAEEFQRLLLMALPLTDRAATLAPDDPTPWAQRLLLATALGAHREAFERTWAEVVARNPAHREAHNFKLMYLCRKWHGSHEEMFAFARQAADAAPDGSPLLVLPVQARAEWAMSECSNNTTLRNIMAVNEVWRNDPGLRAELDRAVNRWFAAPARKHAMWYHDLNYLAYGLVKANRYAEAKPVFTAIGPYMEEIPWGWIGVNDRKEFLNARRKAMRR